MDAHQLLEIAREAQKRAYAPYSRFPVGAALLGKSGKVYTGCNVEISSYGLTVCAERVAVFKAVSEGEQEYEALAVIAPGKGVGLCGACRQVLWDFAPDLIVYGDAGNGAIEKILLRDLLPGAFDKELLAKIQKEGRP